MMYSTAKNKNRSQLVDKFCRNMFLLDLLGDLLTHYPFFIDFDNLPLFLRIPFMVKNKRGPSNNKGKRSTHCDNDNDKKNDLIVSDVSNDMSNKQ